jgi:predicted permease
VIRQDLAQGARRLIRAPRSTTAAVLVLGFGVGVVTAVFSIVNALFLAPLTVHEPDRIVYLYSQSTSGATGRVMPAALEVFASRADGLAGFTRHSQSVMMNLSIDGETQPAAVEVVDGRYFDVLRVAPALGRLLIPADDSRERQAAIVIAHDLWVRRFRSDPEMVGRQIRVTTLAGSITATIVGVAPHGFRGVTDPWRPTMAWLTASQAGSTESHTFPIARLASGVTVERMQAFVDATTADAREAMFLPVSFGARLSRELVDATRFTIRRGSDVRAPADPDAVLISPGLLTALTLIAVLVLVIAAANVSGLLLAQGIARTGEVAVRRALGASSWRLARQWLVEIGLLFAAAGGVGLLVAANLVSLYRAGAPSAHVLDVPVDWRVLAFAAAACGLTAMLVTLAPAIQAARVDVLSALGNGIAMPRKARFRLQHGVIVPQIAVTLALLVLAGVQVRALVRAERAVTGYASDGAIVVRMGLTDFQSPEALLRMPQVERSAYFEADIARRIRLLESITAQVRSATGTPHVALATSLPFRGHPGLFGQTVLGDGSDVPVAAAVTTVSGAYFDALRIALTAGRTFQGSVTKAGRNVVVISQSLASRLWPDRPAIGRSITLDPPRANSPREWLEVIGVAEDVLPVLSTSGDRSVVYLPMSVGTRAGFGAALPLLIVRGAGDSGVVAARVRAAVVGSHPDVEISSLQTAEQIVGEILYPRRIATAILLAAAVVGLLLASVGLYGLISQAVSQRYREIGIRAALGAAPRDLVGLVLRDGARVAAAGLAIGLGASALATRAASAWMTGPIGYEVARMRDAPLLVAAVFALLMIVMAMASYRPAQRAAKVDPIHVLRRF